MPSVLERVGKGLVSFGTGTPQIALDQAQANIDLTRTQEALGQQQVGIQQQEIEAGQAEQAKQQQIQQLTGIAMDPTNPDRDRALTRIFQLSPELGDQVFEGIGARSSAQREDAARRAAEIQATPFEQRNAVIQRQAEDLRVQGRDPSDTEQLVGMSPEDQDNILRFTQAAALSAKERAAAEPEAGFTLAPGQVRFGPTGERIAEVAEPLKAEERITEEREANLKTEEGLRKEFNTLLKDFFQVADANARVIAAGRNPTAAGDLALIFNYMKLLDPGSTVREGEFATAAESAGVPDRVRAQYNRIVSGERLAAPQREDFLNRANELFSAAQGEAMKTADAFEGIATRAGVSSENVIANFLARQRPITEQPTGPVVGAPERAIQFLRTNDTPENRSQFIAKYGALPEDI